jgi:hypothetical protein
MWTAFLGMLVGAGCRGSTGRSWKCGQADEGGGDRRIGAGSVVGILWAVRVIRPATCGGRGQGSRGRNTGLLRAPHLD